MHRGVMHADSDRSYVCYSSKVVACRKVKCHGTNLLTTKRHFHKVIKVKEV